MIERGRLRIRAVVDRRFAEIITLLIILTLLGGFLVYTGYVSPGVHQEQRTVDQWSVEASFSHNGVVTKTVEGTDFQSGSVVENRTVYFQRVMPVLFGRFTTVVSGTDVSNNVSVSQEFTLKSTTGDGDDETVLWSTSESMGRNRTTVESGEPVSVPYRLNVTRAIVRGENINLALGSPGELNLTVRATVVVERQVADAETRRLSFTLPIDVQPGIYRVQTEPQTETFTETETVTVQNEPGALGRVGGPLLLLAGLLGVATLGAGRWRDAFELTEHEREWLVYRDDRTDYDEWVVTMRPPDEIRDLPTVEADTLEDLVNFAIDTDNSVLEAPEGRRFHVIHDGYHYTYLAPNPPTDIG